jgi:hypothetical protein
MTVTGLDKFEPVLERIWEKSAGADDGKEAS